MSTPQKRCKIEVDEEEEDVEMEVGVDNIKGEPWSPGSVNSADEPESPSDCDDGQENSLTRPHPLLMDVIMERVAEHFDYSTLKSARTVCRYWNNIIFRRFRKRTALHVEFNIFTKSILDFVTTFPAPLDEAKAFKRIQIVTPEQLDYHLMTQWMTNYGPYIEYIKFGCDFPSDTNLQCSFSTNLVMNPGMYGISLKSLKMLLLNWCPNLKTLIIPMPHLLQERSVNSANSNSSEEDRENVPIVQLNKLQLGTSAPGFDNRTILNAIEPMTKHIFDLIKSVDTLKLLSPVPNDHGLTYLFSMDQVVIQQTVISTISTLAISGYTIRPAVFKTLSKLALGSLSSFGVSTFTSYTNEDADSFGTFLKVVGPNLKSAGLCNHNVHYSPRLQLTPWESVSSPLSAMKVLKIAIDKWDFGTADFLLNLPNLEELWMYTGEDEGSLSNASDVLSKAIFRPVSNLRVVKHRNLKKFYFRCRTKETGVIRSFVESFPNLTEFHKLHVPADKFSEVLSVLATLNDLQSMSLFIIVSKQVACVGGAIISHLHRFKQLRSLSLDVPKRRLVDGQPGYGNLRLRLGETCFAKGFLRAPSLIKLQLTRVQIPLSAYNIVMHKRCKLQLKLIRSFIRT